MILPFVPLLLALYSVAVPVDGAAPDNPSAAPQRDPAEVTGEIYWEASRLYRPGWDLFGMSQWTEIDIHPWTEPWPERVVASVRRYLDANAACLAVLERASHRPTCKLADTVPSEIEFAFRRWSLLLTYRARWLAQKGAIPEAVKDLFRIYQIRDHQLLVSEGMMARQVANALESAVSEFVRGWGPRIRREALMNLDKRLDRMAKSSPTLAESLRADHGVLIRELRDSLQERLGAFHAEGAVRRAALTQDLIDRVVAGYDQAGRRVMEQAFDRFGRLPATEAIARLRSDGPIQVVTEEEYLVALTRAQELLTDASRTLDSAEQDRIARALNDSITQPMVHFMVSIAASIMPKHLEREARTIARRRATRIAVHLELYRRDHGSFPKSLDQLTLLAAHRIDPFTHEPFRYRLHEEAGYQLWSVGKDGVD
ncbi:MAG: hypothetical protein AAF488_20070, partial [Planctomycetota bacterium]